VVLVVAQELQASSFWMVGVIVGIGLGVHAVHRLTTK
jgi:hypothetical protein